MLYVYMYSKVFNTNDQGGLKKYLCQKKYVYQDLSKKYP